MTDFNTTDEATEIVAEKVSQGISNIRDLAARHVLDTALTLAADELSTNPEFQNEDEVVVQIMASLRRVDPMEVAALLAVLIVENAKAVKKVLV